MTKLPKKTPYLANKGGRHYFRIAIPKELVSVFSKTEHTEALGDINKAQAEVAAAQLGAEWQAKFLRERHRLGLAPQPPVPPKALAPDTRPVVPLTPALISEATGLFHARMLESDEAARQAGFNPQKFEMESLVLEVEASKLRSAYATGDAGLVDSLVGPILPNWLAALGIRVADSDPLLPTLTRELLKARYKGIQGRLGRQNGDLVDTPEEPPLRVLGGLQAVVDASTLAPADKPASTLRLRDVYELWCAKARKPSAKSVSVAGRVVSAFEKVCGDPPLAQLTRKHGLQLRDHFLSTGMAPVTARDRLGWVTTLLRYEMAEGQRIESDPWTNIKVEGSSEAVIERQAVSPAQMTQLFGHELFQTYKLPRARNAGQDAAYWLPIMGAYTGARITELAQLLVADLKQVGEQWFLAIAASEEWQSVKNKPSERTIPLHAELVRLGLPEYAAAMRKAGHKRLFPLVPVSEVNNAGGAFSSWFSKLKSDSGWGPDTTFHSFRHTVETVLRRAEAYPMHLDKYVGHKHDGGEGSKTYAKVFPEDLVKVAGLIQHDSIALPRVFPPAGWSAPAQVESLLRSRPRQVG